MGIANITQKDDIIIIELEGRLDIQESLEVEKRINEIINNGYKKLVFDLSKVEYLSSSGLRIFIAASRRLMPVDGEIKMANMSDQVKKVFDLVELTDLFKIYPTVEEAVRDFK